MDLPESFQCQACQSFLSHPIDTCPVCGDQFYWLLKTSEPPTDQQKKLYLQRVIALVEGRATTEFLTHGDLLWLPYRFWEFDPTGRLLDELPWIVGVELHQHETRSESEEYETQPKMPHPLYVAETVKGEPVETLRARIDLDRRREYEQRQAPRQTRPREVEKEIPEEVSESHRRGLFPARMFAPMMIALFLILLSMSYLVLRYQKNTLGAGTTEEVSHESVLP